MSFILFFLLLGIVSIISQVVIVRELMTAFFGNELFVGIVLGIWLLGTGLGSLLTLKIFPKIKTKKTCFLLEILLCFLLPLLIILIRFLVAKTLLPGEAPSFYQALLFTFLSLFPFCFLLGGLFSLGGKVWAKSNLAFLISRAYFLETIGFAVGGLIFNFLLVSSTFPLSESLNSQTLKFRYPNLVETINSRYGSIAVTKIGNQYNFYENGGFIGTNEEKEGSEYFIHTIFAFQQKPKNILLIGNGLNGPLFEISKYQSIEKIDYVELDPKLVEVQTKYLPSYLTKVPKNPKINIHFLDARRFLKQTKKDYDLVILNFPNPSTAFLNRFYTQECFQEVKRLLATDGILAFTLDVPVDYLSEEAKGLVFSINKTIKSVFPHILFLPEETSILFISSNAPLPAKKELITDQVETDYFTRQYLSYRLSSAQINRLKNLLAETRAKINTDFSPTAYFYQTAFWQTTQSFQLAKILKGTEKINWLMLSIFTLLVLLFLKNKLASPILSMGIASFTLMTIEILIIFLFQSQLGHLFSKIALIFTTILLSMGIGNCVGTKVASSSPCHSELDSESIKIPKRALSAKKQFGNDVCIKSLLLIKLSIILYLLLFFPIIKNFSQEPVFYLLGGIIGILVGTVFPLTNKIYLKRTEKVGVLYSSDLFGAFFGAVLPSLFFIPVFGTQKTIVLLITFNLFCLF